MNDNFDMPKRGKWLNEEMWQQVVEWRKGGLYYGQICGRLNSLENMERFGLEEIPSEDTVRREVNRRVEAEGSRQTGTELVASSSVEDDLAAKDIPALQVSIGTNCEGRHLRSHEFTSSLETFSVFFSLVYSGQEIVRFLRLHVWFLSPYVRWDLDRMESAGWTGEGYSPLPEESKAFSIEEYGEKAYARWTLSLSPESNFFLIPGSQSYGLPPLDISCRDFTGMIPMPWRIECPEVEAVSGTLLFWCNKDGVFNSESIGPDVDADELRRRNMRFLIRNGVTEMPLWKPLPGFSEEK